MCTSRDDPISTLQKKVQQSAVFRLNANSLKARTRVHMCYSLILHKKDPHHHLPLRLYHHCLLTCLHTAILSNYSIYTDTIAILILYTTCFFWAEGGPSTSSRALLSAIQRDIKKAAYISDVRKSKSRQSLSPTFHYHFIAFESTFLNCKRNHN